jgi:uncharacterized OB-fold protein
MRFPPRPMCPRCHSMKSEWTEVSGRGTIYSFVVAHAPVLPAFQSKLPLGIVLVALDEDETLRMVGNVEGEPAIGAKVEVFFERVAPDVVLPQWRVVP